MNGIKKVIFLAALCGAMMHANDDFSDWVLIPSGELVLKNDSAHPVALMYQVPVPTGTRQGNMWLQPKTKAEVGISAYQLFRGDLKILWDGHDVVIPARKHLGELFEKKYGVPFKCNQVCCTVSCQTEALIRAFQPKGKREGKRLLNIFEEFKRFLTGKKVILEFSSDANGNRLTTKIDQFSVQTQFGKPRDVAHRSVTEERSR